MPNNTWKPYGPSGTGIKYWHNLSIAVGASKGTQLLLEAERLSDSSTATETARLLDEALETFEKTGEREGQACALHMLGVIWQEEGNFEEAAMNFDKALAIWRTSDTYYGLAMTCTSLGDLAYEQEARIEALRQYFNAYEFWVEAEENNAAAEVLIQIGTISIELGETDEARDFFARALELDEETTEIRLDAFMGLGDCDVATGDLVAAQSAYEQRLHMARLWGDNSAIGRALLDLALVASLNDEADVEAAFVQEAKEEFIVAGDNDGHADCLMALGSIAAEEAEWETAKEFLSKAVPLYRLAENPVGHRNALAALGQLHLELEEWPAAQQYLSQAVQLGRLVNDSDFQLATELSQLGFASQRTGDVYTARKSWEESLSLWAALHHHDREADTASLLEQLPPLDSAPLSTPAWVKSMGLQWKDEKENE